MSQLFSSESSQRLRTTWKRLHVSTILIRHQRIPNSKLSQPWKKLLSALAWKRHKSTQRVNLALFFPPPAEIRSLGSFSQVWRNGWQMGREGWGRNGKDRMREHIRLRERDVSGKVMNWWKKANQPKSKINLQKCGGVPVKGERETIWKWQAVMRTVYLVKPLALSSGGKSDNCRA